MATKAELEAELAELRQKLSETPAADSAGKQDAPASPDQGSSRSMPTGLQDVLKEHEVDIGDLDAIWDQLLKELDDLPTRKPLLTSIAAFSLGFILGRLTK